MHDGSATVQVITVDAAQSMELGAPRSPVVTYTSPPAPYRPASKTKRIPMVSIRQRPMPDISPSPSPPEDQVLPHGQVCEACVGAGLANECFRLTVHALLLCEAYGH